MELLTVMFFDGVDEMVNDTARLYHTDAGSSQLLVKLTSANCYLLSGGKCLREAAPNKGMGRVDPQRFDVTLLSGVLLSVYHHLLFWGC